VVCAAQAVCLTGEHSQMDEDFAAYWDQQAARIRARSPFWDDFAAIGRALVSNVRAP